MKRLEYTAMFLCGTHLSQQTESSMEIGWAETNHYQEQPDDVDTIATVPGVIPVEDHQEGRHDEEQHVRDGVDELGDVRGEGVVVLTPVYGTGAPLQMAPHGSQYSSRSHIWSAKLKISGIRLQSPPEPGLYQE